MLRAEARDSLALSVPSSTLEVMQQLTDRQRAILDHEALTWRWAGAKDASILERFDVTLTRYYAELHATLALPAALAYAPTTVRRLLRLAEARRRARTAS